MANDLEKLIEKFEMALLDMSFEASSELKSEMKEMDKIEKELQRHTDTLLPGARIGNLEDEELEILSEDPHWLELYKKFYYYDERWEVAQKIKSIIADAAGRVGDLI